MYSCKKWLQTGTSLSRQIKPLARQGLELAKQCPSLWPQTDNFNFRRPITLISVLINGDIYSKPPLSGFLTKRHFLLLGTTFGHTKLISSCEVLFTGVRLVYSACNHSIYTICTQWLHPLLVSPRMLSVYFLLLIDYTQYAYFLLMDTPWYHAARIREVLL